MCFHSFYGFFIDCQAIGGAGPRTSQISSKSPKAAKTVLFRNPNAKTSVFSAAVQYVFFFPKSIEVIMFSRLLQFCVWKTLNSCVSLTFPALSKIFNLSETGPLDNANRWKIIDTAGKAGTAYLFHRFLVKKAGKARKTTQFSYFL